MTDTQEEWLASTFVELADTLVADFDVVEFLTMLVARCTAFLDGPEVGLAVANKGGRLRVLASSTERMKVLELVEVQNDEGPCRDSFHTGQQIINQRVDRVESQWPAFIPMARTAGFVMLHAFPMRLRGKAIGAINIFDVRLREMTGHEAATVSYTHLDVYKRQPQQSCLLGHGPPDHGPRRPIRPSRVGRRHPQATHPAGRRCRGGSRRQVGRAVPGGCRPPPVGLSLIHI